MTEIPGGSRVCGKLSLVGWSDPLRSRDEGGSVLDNGIGIGPGNEDWGKSSLCEGASETCVSRSGFASDAKEWKVFIVSCRCAVKPEYDASTPDWTSWSLNDRTVRLIWSKMVSSWEIRLLRPVTASRWRERNALCARRVCIRRRCCKSQWLG